jgi:hypothetical protein
MEIVGLMLVRNEADILRVNVLHHLAQGIDRFLIVDNGSTDGTDRVLQELARGGRVHWRRQVGPYRQAEMTTELARQAWRNGADWVIPIDADEFWYAPGRNFRRVLGESNAGGFQVQVVNFIQRRDQIDPSPTALLQMTRRPPQAVGPVELAVELIEACQMAFVEHAYVPKWISRANSALEIRTGNHGVDNLVGSVGPTDRIVCLHAPMRARALLEARTVDLSRRAAELGEAGDVFWHYRRWGKLAETFGLELALEREWAANSYADDCLDVYGKRHPLTFDPMLRDVIRPWLKTDRPAIIEMPRTDTPAKTASRLPIGAGVVSDSASSSIVQRMRGIEGWLFEPEASLLMTTVILALAGRKPHAVVEIGSYCGRSTVVLGGVVKAICPSAKVYAIDPHEGELTWPGRGIRIDPPTLAQFRTNIEEAGLTGVVETIQKRSVEVPWDKPISMLFIDGLHDYENVSRDFEHFAPWVVDGGYVAFDDYDDQSFPGVVECVTNVLNSGSYRRFRRIGRIMVVQKQPGSTSEDDRHSSHEDNCNPAVEVVRAILEEPLQVSLLEWTEWAERLEHELARRTAVMDELQQAVAERTAWAERMVTEAEQRGAIIEQLQQTLAERTAWAERMVAESEQRGVIIEELQRALAERAAAQNG